MLLVGKVVVDYVLLPVRKRRVRECTLETGAPGDWWHGGGQEERKSVEGYG